MNAACEAEATVQTLEEELARKEKLAVIIVDDSPTMREIVRRTVVEAGLKIDRIFSLSSADVAWSVLQEEDIDLILTDLHMPGMSGTDFIRWMQKTGLLPQLPVIVVSTDGTPDRLRELRAAGIRGFVRKPFFAKDFSRILRGEPFAGFQEMNADLSEQLCEILARFCRMFAEPIEKDGLPENLDAGLIGYLPFTGSVSGRLQVAAPAKFAAEVSAACLGEEPFGRLSMSFASDAMREILNIFCGCLVTPIEQGGGRVRFLPAELMELTQEGWRRMKSDPTSLAIVAGDNPVLFRFRLLQG